MSRAALIALTVTLVLTPLLAALPGLGGRTDRNPGRRPVPPVGGLAVGIALLLTMDPSEGPWLAPLLALAHGMLDDRCALKFEWKLAGQVPVAAVLALELVTRGGLDPWHALGLGLASICIVNLLNTWDHADGLCAGQGTLALLSAPAGGGHAGWALLGFLPWNLGGSPAARGERRSPRAYLGDGGSQLVGVLVALQPQTWGLLLVPALDLARVMRERSQAGQPLRQGDRRHLGHRLERKGLGPAAAAVLCLAPSAPLAIVGPRPWALLVAVAAFSALVWWTRPAAACSDTVR